MKTGKIHPQGNPSRRSEASRRGQIDESSSLEESGWRLPSGQTLAEFALRAGCIAPVLMLKHPFEEKNRRKGRQQRQADAGRIGLPADAGVRR